MARSHGTRFPLLCCCLLTLIFIARHVNSTGGGAHVEASESPSAGGSPSASGSAPAGGSSSRTEQSSAGPSASPSAHQRPNMLTHQQQHQQEPSASLPPYKFWLNGGSQDTPSSPNIYPLSKSQLTAELDQKIMAERIAFNDGHFHPELERIIEALHAHLSMQGVHLYDQYKSKSWTQLLRGWMDEAIKNTKADNTDLLFEILVTTTNKQKQEMGLYNSDICDRMLKHPVVNRKENRGYKTLMRHLCKEKRDESYDDHQKDLVAHPFIEALKDYLIKEGERKLNVVTKNQKAEENIAKSLAKSNYSRLRYAFEKEYFGMDTVSALLERMMKGNKNEQNDEVKKNSEKKILQAIYAIHMDVKQGRPEMLYHLFYMILKKLNKDKDMDAFLRDTGRLLITHAQVDLADIGTNNLNMMKNWLTSAKTLSLNGNRVSPVQHKQLDAFIQIVDLMENDNWKKHFKKTD